MKLFGKLTNGLINTRLEHGVKDQKKLKEVTPTLSKLEDLQDRWRDDYTANKLLREQFRVSKVPVWD